MLINKKINLKTSAKILQKLENKFVSVTVWNNLKKKIIQKNNK